MTQAPQAARTAVAVNTATLRDVPAIAFTLADAFSIDRVFEWCVPDQGRRNANLPRFFELFARTVGQTGELYLADGGAAIWVPPAIPAVPPEQDAEFGAALEAILAEDAERTFAVMSVLDENHPHEPHYYLPFLGVRRSQQGKGIGSALLREVLARCDRDAIPAYLEATNKNNRRLYERHGFAVQRELAVDGCPSLYAMWRDPVR